MTETNRTRLAAALPWLIVVVLTYGLWKTRSVTTEAQLAADRNTEIIANMSAAIFQAASDRLTRSAFQTYQQEFISQNGLKIPVDENGEPLWPTLFQTNE